MKKRVVIISILVVVVVACVLFIPKGSDEGTVEWITEVVKPSRIRQSITATGTVEPVTQVEVGTQVSGILTSLYVDYNSIVKKGQIIAELDKSTLLLDLANKKSNVSVNRSEFEFEKANYNRVKTLHDKKLVADSEYELALYNYQRAENGYEVAKNDLVRSQTNLEYATIYSPIDGVVLSKSVEQGQTVASSFNTPTLFTIAANLTDMRVIADVDEADIGGVEVGQSVTFTVDAYPDSSFDGVVTNVRQQAVVVSNVVTYEVEISAANPELKLKPGLTASVEILTLDVECSCTVPTKALTFSPRPTGEMSQSENTPRGSGARGEMGRGENFENSRGLGNSERRGRSGMSRDAGLQLRGGDIRHVKVGENRVWVKRGKEIFPQSVVVGATNGLLTQVEGLTKGDSVIVGVKSVVSIYGGAPKMESNPFMPKRGGRK